VHEQERHTETRRSRVLNAQLQLQMKTAGRGARNCTSDVHTRLQGSNLTALHATIPVRAHATSDFSKTN